MNFRSCRGFTLIELLIAIALIALLASLAVPEYRRHMARAQFIEGPELISGYKSSLLEWVSSEGRCPTAEDAAYLGAGDAHGRYISGLMMGGTLSPGGGCTITATFRTDDTHPALSGRRVVVSLQLTEGAASWQCRSNVDAHYLPKECVAE